MTPATPQQAAPAGYQQLLGHISDTYTQGRSLAVQAVNAHLTQTYWQVGRHIVEFEQGGDTRAEYGKALIHRLAADLGLRHGKGFSRSNLIRIRQFYLAYPKGATASHLLSWSHWVELLKLDDPLERSFYEQQIPAVPARPRRTAARAGKHLAHRRARRRGCQPMNTLILIAACACWVSARDRFGLKLGGAHAAQNEGSAVWR